MAIKEKIVNDVAILTVHGNLMGGSETQELRDKVYSLIADGIIKVVVNLSKVSWINSTGLGALMACYTSLINKNGELAIAHATDKVNSLLMITQLIKIFKNYETVDRAVASFQKSNK